MTGIRANFHTHTTYCDGAGSPREMAEAALALGFTSLGFSGHIDIDPVMDVAAYLKEIRALAEEYRGRIDILCGGEVDLLYPELGRIAGPDETADADAYRLDYRIGSVHHLKTDAGTISVDYSEEEYLRLLETGFGGDVYKMTAAYFESVSKVFDVIRCTFAGHFDLITKYNDRLHLIDEDDPRYLEPAYAAMEYLVSQGVPFEINTRMAGKGRIYPGKNLLKRLSALGAEILISSDAHHPSETARGFEKAAEYAKSCGFDHTNYLVMRDGEAALVPVKL